MELIQPSEKATLVMEKGKGRLNSYIINQRKVRRISYDKKKRRGIISYSNEDVDLPMIVVENTKTAFDKGSSNSLAILPNIVKSNYASEGNKNYNKLRRTVSNPSIQSSISSGISADTLYLSDYPERHGSVSQMSNISNRSSFSQYGNDNKYDLSERQKKKEARMIARIKKEYFEEYVNYTDGPQLDELPPNLSYLLRRYKITKIPPKLKPKPKKPHPHLKALLDSNIIDMDTSEMSPDEIQQFTEITREITGGKINPKDSKIASLNFKELSEEEMESYEKMAEQLEETLLSEEKTKYMSSEQKENMKELIELLKKKLRKEKNLRLRKNRGHNYTYIVRKRHIWTELERRRQEKIAKKMENLENDYYDDDHDHTQCAHTRCAYWNGEV